MNATDGVDYSTPTTSFNTQQPVTSFPVSDTVSVGNVAYNDDQTAASSTADECTKIKNKRRQPKYRATKRPPSERRFQCDHCESRFFTQKDVKRHLVVHTGVRNFPCPYCTQRFGRKDHLVRHAKKTHDQDTRSFKRRNRAANNSPSNVTETKKAKKSTSQRSRRKDGNFAAVQPNSTASIATVTSTSQSTSYYMHDNGYNSSDRVAATSNQSYNSDSTIMLTSTTSTSTLNSSFPKTVTLVDRPTTSTLTASSFTHSRNYPSFNHFEPSSTNFSYGTNSSFNPHHPHHHHHHHPFLSDNGNTQYPLQLTSNSIYLNYDYKPSGINYGCNSHQEEFSNASSRSVHLGIGPSSSSNVSSFKTITSSIVDGFNTCIDLEYNNTGMNPFNASSATVTIAAPHPPPPSQQQPPPPPSSTSNVPFTENGGGGQLPRFPSQFN